MVLLEILADEELLIFPRDICITIDKALLNTESLWDLKEHARLQEIMGQRHLGAREQRSPLNNLTEIVLSLAAQGFQTSGHISDVIEDPTKGKELFIQHPGRIYHKTNANAT